MQNIIVFNAALGSFFNGMSLGQMNIISTDIEKAFQIKSAFEIGLLQTAFTIGGALGAVLSVFVLKQLSRRNALVITDMLAILACIMSVSETKQTSFIVTRVMIGICVGLNSVIIPIYIKEMSPKNLQGYFGTFNQIFVTMGILLQFGLGYTRHYDYGFEFYEFILLLPLIPCIIRSFLLKTILNYETPFYCVQHNLNEKLMKTLNLLFDNHKHLIEELQISTKQQKYGSFKMIFHQKYKKRLLVGLVLASVQQFGGINAIIFYSSSIFDVVTSHDEAMVNFLNVIVGLVGLMTALFAGYLIEQYGRKILLYYGTLACFISLQLLWICIYSESNAPLIQNFIVMLIFLFLFGFGFSLGPLLFIYITEILPEQGVSLSVFVNWISAALVAQIFPIIGMKIGFFSFAIINLFAFIFVDKFLIETKGKSEEQIEQLFEQQGKQAQYQQAYQDEEEL